MKSVLISLCLILGGCSDVLANYDYEIMGSLRQYNGQWCWIKDRYHQPINIGDRCASSDDGSLTVDLGTKYDQVLTLIASPDETFAANGYTFGASVGLDRFILRGSQNGVRIDFRDEHSSGNIWIYGKMRKF